jgi:hypothetical protein
MFRSKAQNAWAHTPAGEKALGGPAKVKEWEQATNYSSLPEHVGEKKKKPEKMLRHTTRPRRQS